MGTTRFPLRRREHLHLGTVLTVQLTDLESEPRREPRVSFAEGRMHTFVLTTLLHKMCCGKARLPLPGGRRHELRWQGAYRRETSDTLLDADLPLSRQKAPYSTS